MCNYCTSAVPAHGNSENEIKLMNKWTQSEKKSENTCNDVQLVRNEVPRAWQISRVYLILGSVLTERVDELPTLDL